MNISLFSSDEPVLASGGIPGGGGLKTPQNFGVVRRYLNLVRQNLNSILDPPLKNIRH